MFGQLNSLLANSYYRKSIMLYLVLIIAVSVLGWLSQDGIESLNHFIIGKRCNNIMNKRNRIKLIYMQRICFFMAFFLLWFFSSFATCGADRETYGIIFKDSTWQSVFDGWQEPGFIIFNLIFRIFGDNPQIIYMAISTITLVLFFRTLDYLRNEISIGFALLAYGCLYYVQSLSLMRIYMAASILFWGVRYLKEEMYWKYGLVIIITGMIHYSSFILLLPFIILYLTYNKRYNMRVHFYGVAGALGVGIAVLLVGAPMLSNIIIFSRFQRYLEEISTARIGVMQFVYFLPICFLIWLVFSQYSENYKRTFFVFTAVAFFIGVLSYVIPILGRAFSLFSIVYFWVIPYSLRIVKNLSKKRWTSIGISVLVIGYYLFRFTLYLVEYAKLDDIIPYTNRIL